MREHQHVSIEFKSMDDDKGSFEAYLSVFDNVDFGGDKVIKGAFKRCLEEKGSKLFPLLDQHDSRNVIGGFSAYEDNHGLKITGEFNLDTQKGAEAYSNAKKGFLSGFSMGYSVEKYSIDGNVRNLEDVELYEGSIVTFPMNDKAQLLTIKSGETLTERQFEKFLRDAGYSRQDAKAIIADGYKGYLNRRDAGKDEPQIEEAALVDYSPLENVLSNLQELNKWKLKN